MFKTRRLNTRLWRAFVLQILLISATAFAGVFLAEFAIRELLIVSALEREADYFWARHKIESNTRAPNTNTLIGYYFEHGEPPPDEFAGLQNGIHDVLTAAGKTVVHVSTEREGRLFLVFDAQNVQQLATYFGVAPLALLLVVLYSGAWIAFRISRRAVSPVIRLARELADVDIEAQKHFEPELDLQSTDMDSEVRQLVVAVQQLMNRVNQFVERERLFAREASHELRTPLTVIRMASNSLLGRDDLSDSARNMAEKVQRSAHDMHELTEALLLLAREHEGKLAEREVSVNGVVDRELAAAQMVYGSKQLVIAGHSRGRLWVTGYEQILGIVLGNLIRNACAYTDQGTVSVIVDTGSVQIVDSGIGIAPENIGNVFEPYYRGDNNRESGHGIGLSLVRRVTDRFGWEIEIESAVAKGTSITLKFPDTRFDATRDAPIPSTQAAFEPEVPATLE
ncbi:MAG: HAMP domain-containing sensor histidine kinase [Pseudomonadota bacterium]